MTSVAKKRRKTYISKNKKILLELVKQEEKKDKEKDGND